MVRPLDFGRARGTGVSVECQSWLSGAEPHDVMETVGQKHQKLRRGSGGQ